MTTEIISTRYKGVLLQAIGAYGCKYTLAVVLNDGRKWNTGSRTVKAADWYFEVHEEIKQMVLYIYHKKKRSFEVRKYYERSATHP